MICSPVLLEIFMQQYAISKADHEKPMKYQLTLHRFPRLNHSSAVDLRANLKLFFMKNGAIINYV